MPEIGPVPVPDIGLLSGIKQLTWHGFWRPFIPQYKENTYKSANLFNFGELYWTGVKEINAGN